MGVVRDGRMTPGDAYSEAWAARLTAIRAALEKLPGVTEFERGHVIPRAAREIAGQSGRGAFRAYLPAVLQKATPGGRGQPDKPAAINVALLAAQHYQVLAKKAPTISNPWNGGRARGAFVTLLEEVFAAMGISASAPSQAKKAVEFMRDQRRKS